MGNKSRMAKAVIILFIIMVSSFLIALAMLAGEGWGKNGFNIESSKLAGSTTKVDEEKTSGMDGINTVRISASSEDVNVIPIDSGELKAHLYGEYTTSNKDSRIELSLERNGDSLDIKIIRLPVNNLTLFSYSTMKLDVYVPKTYTGDLDADVSSAGVTITTGLELDKLNINSSSGDLTIYRIKAKDAELETSSGKANITGDFNSLIMNSSSGDMELEDVKAKEAKLQTSSGKATLSGEFTSFSFTSTSGDLISENFKSDTTKLQTSSGKVILKGSPGTIEAADSSSGDLMLEYSSDVHSIRRQTSSGKTTITLPVDAAFAVDFESSSGDVVCDFPVTITGSQKDNKLAGTVNGGTERIIVRSSSGDLAINKR